MSSQSKYAGPVGCSPDGTPPAAPGVPDPSNWGLPIPSGATIDRVASPTELNGCAVYYTVSNAPEVPTELQAAYESATSVSLSWMQGEGTVSYNHVRFRVPGGPWTTVKIVAATSFVVTDLAPGQLYFFAVNAFGWDESSDWTSPVPWYAGSTLTREISGSARDAFENSSGAVALPDSTDTPAASESLGFVSFYRRAAF